MIKTISRLTSALLLSVYASSAHAGEYESAWQETDQCFAQYEQVLATLPVVETAPLNDLLKTYDKHSNETRCTLAFGLTHSRLEDIGYYTIVEYRDDLHSRIMKYRAILALFSDWTKSVKTNRSDFVDALQARIDAKPKPYDLHEARMKWLNSQSQTSGASK